MRIWQRCACIAVIAAVASGCGGARHERPGPPPAPVPRAGDFVGIYADDVFFGGPGYRRATLAQLRRAGVGLIRQPFAWNAFAADQARYDDFVGAAARQGIRVLPIVLGPEPGAPNATGGMAPPRNVGAFARYAATLVRRYGPGGSFWSQHPELPQLAITSWQVWNEPNIPAFWAGGPDPSAYARLLESTATAIRRVDRRADVVTAGLPTSHMGIPADAFLEGVYRAGAKGSFDSVAIHAYAPTPAALLAHVRAARAVISRNGDHAHLWITEFGWGTGGKPGPLTVDPQRQATYIAETLRALKAQRHALGLQGVVLFQWHDPKPFAGRRDIWPYYAGLIDAYGKPKPALAAFTKVASS